MDAELGKNEALPPGDEKRMTSEEVREYEDFLTQAEALAIILPRLLQQVRIVQYEPRIQKQLQEVFAIIQSREALLEEMELARATILQGSARRNRPIPPSEIAQLVPIATLAWMLREKLSFRPELTEAQREALLRNLKAQRESEAAYKGKTEETGKNLEDAALEADKARKRAGSERVAQGLPGAELILDTPDISIAMWERLLLEGGSREKVRYAKELREGIALFEQDFLKLRAYDEFEAQAKRKLQENILKNKGIGYWFELLKIPGKDVATTTPGEFQQVFDEVMTRTKGEFEKIATAEDAAACAELLTLLREMERGKSIDEKRLRELLASYTRLQQQAGALLAALQRWQIAENVDRVGGAGDANMLEQVTRVGEKGALGHLRELAPYGIFRLRSYRDEDGRLILLAPAADTSQFKTQLTEGAKAYLTMEAAILIPLLHRMAMRIPLLGRVFRPWYVRLGVPIALAEVSMAGADAGARGVRMEQAVDAIEQCVKSLDASKGRFSSAEAKKVGDSLFEHLLIAMQAAEGAHPGTPRQDIALEAHIYTNQILTALGYPPYHEISPTVMPDKAARTLSPEVRQYLAVKESERAGIQRETRERIEALRSKVAAARRGRTAPTEKPRSPVDVILQDEVLPPVFDKEKLQRILADASQAPEFHRKGGKMEQALQGFGETEKEQTGVIFDLAGDAYFIAKRLRQLDYKYRKGKRGDIHDDIPKDELGPVEEEVAHLIHEVPLVHILAAARYLESHEPTNEEIANVWYREGYPKGVFQNFLGMQRRAVDTEINRRFGNPGNRTGLGKKFLQDWVDLWDYARYYVPEEKKTEEEK